MASSHYSPFKEVSLLQLVLAAPEIEQPISVLRDERVMLVLADHHHCDNKVRARIPLLKRRVTNCTLWIQTILWYSPKILPTRTNNL